MPKPKKELSEEQLEKINQEFSQTFADAIYDAAESIGHKYHKKYGWDTTISVFNVMLSITANYAVELGMPVEDFVDICKDFWKNADELINAEEEILEQEDWLKPRTTSKDELS